MLHEFLIANRPALIALCRAKVAKRPAPRASDAELPHGIPLFLEQLIQMLQLERASPPAESSGGSGAAEPGRTPVSSEISATATKHGNELLGQGFTVDQVVHNYGDLCQAITELAVEHDAPVTTQEFRTLNGCLDNAIADAEVQVAGMLEAKSRGCALTVRPVDHGLAVDADRQMLSSAVANLLQNAFKFTEPHSHVSLRACRSPGNRVLIEVEDECGGLGQGAAEKIFRPFEQGGADRSGVGLGLSITRRSIEANGGTVRVRDLPGKGCVFTIDLPAARTP